MVEIGKVHGFLEFIDRSPARNTQDTRVSRRMAAPTGWG